MSGEKNLVFIHVYLRNKIKIRIKQPFYVYVYM